MLVGDLEDVMCRAGVRRLGDLCRRSKPGFAAARAPRSASSIAACRNSVSSYVDIETEPPYVLTIRATGLHTCSTTALRPGNIAPAVSIARRAPGEPSYPIRIGWVSDALTAIPPDFHPP